MINQNQDKVPEEKRAPSKKKHNPWSRRKKRIVLCTSFCALGVGIGRVGFRLFGHSAPKNNYDGFFAGYDYLSLKDTSSRNDITGKEKDRKKQAVRLVNTGFVKMSLAKYGLRYISQVVNVKIGNTKQEIEAFTYFSPEVNFNQNISSSTFVHTADRYYDHKDGKIERYSESTPDKWKDATPVEYSYDDRRGKRGKLVAPLYFLNQDKKGNRKFESYDSSSKDWNTQESGIVNFDFSSDSVSEATWTKKGLDYLVHIERDSDHAIGYKKRARQRQRTGGLKNLPNFKTVSIDFTLDATLSLKKAVTKCNYIAAMAGIQAECVSTDNTYFYTSDTPFSSSGQELTIPGPQEETGDKGESDEPKLLAYARGLSK